jgi:F0F1-type ATP synthase assembly protein I
LADGPTPEQRAQLNQVGIATGLGCSIVVSVILTIGGGVLLDRALDTAPILTLVGVALGLIAAGYQLYELAQVGQTGRKAPPITRGVEKLAGARKQTGPRR